MTNDSIIGADRPLQTGTALSADKLSRGSFAKAAVQTLRRVNSNQGLVLSIEGAWGSGKTSTLAMIEDLLRHEPTKPIVVQFNPWLVGDRDALLRQFLTKLATTLELEDRAREGKKVAKEIKAYSKAFDVLKLIPGAEPWASIVKSVFESVGEAVNSTAEHKAKDVEQHRTAVDTALRKYSKPIVVFIDDIDRLFPAEVFEMTRIVKAVGDLPNVGYVLSWDPEYVSRALANLNIPFADLYLDKIVQMRMSLPSLSLSAKQNLINTALSGLCKEAHFEYFKNQNERFNSMYFSGFGDLLEQPRDVTRVFNVVAAIEPVLRGEIVLSDIVGLATLMTKATPVFELLKKHPKWFVGRMQHDGLHFGKSEDIVKDGAAKREEALEKCQNAAAVGSLVHHMFPATAKADGKVTLDRTIDVDGHIAHPSRLRIALQMSVSPSDVSLVSARCYLFSPVERGGIAASIKPESAYDFLGRIGDLAKSLDASYKPELENFCIAVAALADAEQFALAARMRAEVFSLDPASIAIEVVSAAVEAVDSEAGPDICRQIVESRHALTVSAELLANSYADSREKRGVFLPEGEKERNGVLNSQHEAILLAIASNHFFDLASPERILWTQALLVPDKCREIFDKIKEMDATLDSFVFAFLKFSFDSSKGQTFSLPEDPEVLEAYVSLDDFQEHARQRLRDEDLENPAKAAWRSVVERKKLYAIDGTEARL